MIVNQKNNVIEANIKEYEILTFDQYLDLSEDRKVTNAWYISLSKNHDANKYAVVVLLERYKFYNQPFQFRVDVQDPENKLVKPPNKL